MITKLTALPKLQPFPQLTPFQKRMAAFYHNEIGIEGTEALYAMMNIFAAKLSVAQQENRDLKALLREVGVDVD